MNELKLLQEQNDALRQLLNTTFAVLDRQRLHLEEYKKQVAKLEQYARRLGEEETGEPHTESMIDAVIDWSPEPMGRERAKHWLFTMIRMHGGAPMRDAFLQMCGSGEEIGKETNPLATWVKLARSLSSRRYSRPPEEQLSETVVDLCEGHQERAARKAAERANGKDGDEVDNLPF